MNFIEMGIEEIILLRIETFYLFHLETEYMETIIIDYTEGYSYYYEGEDVQEKWSKLEDFPKDLENYSKSVKFKTFIKNEE